METVLIVVAPTVILQIAAINDTQCSESYIHLFTVHMSTPGSRRNLNVLVTQVRYQPAEILVVTHTPEKHAQLTGACRVQD